jgi:hypothetical protein
MLLLYFFHAPSELQQSLCADEELADALDHWSRTTAPVVKSETAD